MTRDDALALVHEYVKNEGLVRHMLSVEACLRFYAEKLGEDVEAWGLLGLIHDFDWEIHPTAPDHPLKGEPILAERGVSEEVRRAILSHGNDTGVPRQSRLEKTLFACDEIAGFLTAVSLVKPRRSIFEVDAASVKKKMKDKAFARSVHREDIVQGAAELGVPLEEHIETCIRAMQAIAEQLALQGIQPATS